jgi:hypothetical protein
MGQYFCSDRPSQPEPVILSRKRHVWVWEEKGQRNLNRILMQKLGEYPYILAFPKKKKKSLK